MERKRGLWLIDGGYLWSSQTSVEPGYQFDYRKLRAHVENDGPIWRAYFLNSVPMPISDQQAAFHNWLRSAPPFGPKIITKLYPLRSIAAHRARCEACGENVGLECPHGRGAPDHRLSRQEQKGVDVGIATLALALVDEYDTLLLSSGDADLLDAIEHLCERGKQFELVVFRVGVSTELQSRADRIYWIDDVRNEVRNARRSAGVEVADTLAN